MKLVCIKCPRGCNLTIDENSMEVSGNLCPRGALYAKDELVMPMRILTSLVRFGDSGQWVPVKTSREIPKDMIKQVLELLKKAWVKEYVKIGTVLYPNILDLGVDIIATGEPYYL